MPMHRIIGVPNMLKSISGIVFKCTGALRRDDGVAALAIAAVIMIAASTALSTFLAATSSATVRDLKRAQSGSSNLALIHDALQVAALQNADMLLPCPADPTAAGAGFGVAPAAVGTACAVTRGIVPFQSLGLSESDVKDGVGNYITYLVDDDNVGVCNKKYPNTGDLIDQRDNAAYLFALISHGNNGAGAYSSPNNPTSATASASEDDNCMAAGSAHPQCTAPDNLEFRSGPTDLTDGSATYFDDIVMVADSTKFTWECIDATGDPMLVDDSSSNDRPAGAETSFESSQANDNFNNATSGNRRNAQITTVDPDAGVDGDEYVQVYLRGQGNQARSSCFWNEGAVRLENSKVRAYVEPSFEEDTGAGIGERRGGLIMGFLRGDEPIVDALCGGPDTLMGWEDGPSNTLPTEKFGVEIDVEGNVADPDAANEPSVNHMAINATNIDHTGEDPSLPARHAPACVDGVGSFSDVGDGRANKREDDLAAMEGCYPNVVNWLESGISTFHGFRVELDNTSENRCPSPNLSWVRINAWIFENGRCDGKCEDLRADYYGRDPTVSYCLPYEMAYRTLRFGFTSGLPDTTPIAANEVRIRRFGIRSDLVELPDKDAAAETSETAQLSSLNIEDEVFPGGCTGNETADTSIAVDDDILSGGSNPRNPSFSSLRGNLACNADGRTGLQGLDGREELSNQGVAIAEWADLFNREALQIEFPETVNRFMVHLRNFADPAQGNTTEADRAVILAYNQDEYIGRQNVTATCGTADDWMISGAFSGATFDRLVVLPEPADQTYTDTNGYSRFWVDGVKGCGAENICTAESVDDLPLTEGLINDCYVSDVATFELPNSVAAGDETPQMNYTDVIASHGTGNIGAWENFSGYDMNVFVPSGDDINLSGNTTRGFGVNSATGDSSSEIEADVSESITFLFDRAFNKLRLNISRFTENLTDLERASIEFRRGSTVVGSATVQACAEVGDGANGARMFEFDTSALGAFDRTVITALPRTVGPTDTQFTIREIRACEAASGDCTLSANASSTCLLDLLGTVSVAVSP